MDAPAQYSVLGPLKSGAQTRAFLGCEVHEGVPQPDRPVVVIWLPDDIVSDAKRVARLQRETAFVTQLEHPNIIRVHGLECFEEGWARVVDFVDGEPLHRVLSRAREEQTPLEPRLAARIALDVCDAVDYAHEEGQSRFAGRPVVHGGLRPDTLMMTFSGRTTVTGYGASVLAPTQKGAPVREKFVYLAPEQIIGGKATASPATDIYAIGALLYELVAGKAPFADAEDVERAVLTGEPPHVEAPGLAGRLGNVASVALAKRGSDRFESVDAMREAVRAALEDEPLASQEEVAAFVGALIPPDAPERANRAELLASAEDPDAVTILNPSPEAPEGIDPTLYARARATSTAGRAAKPRDEATVTDGGVVRTPRPREADTVIEAPVPAGPMEEAATQAEEAAAPPVAAAPSVTSTAVTTEEHEAAAATPDPAAAAPQPAAPDPASLAASPAAPPPAPAAPPPAPQAPIPAHAMPQAQIPTDPRQVPPTHGAPPPAYAVPPAATDPRQARPGYYPPPPGHPGAPPHNYPPAPGHPGAPPPGYPAAPGQPPPGWTPAWGHGQAPPGASYPPQPNYPPNATYPPMPTPSGTRPAPRGYVPSAAKNKSARRNYLDDGSAPNATSGDLLQNQPVSGLPPPPKSSGGTAVRSNSQITQFNKKAGDSSRAIFFLVLAGAAAMAVFIFLSKEPPEGLDAPPERHKLPKELVQAALQNAKGKAEMKMRPAEAAEGAAADGGVAPEAAADRTRKAVATEPGKLSLDTDPSVSVFDGKTLLGRTPFTTSMDPGRYRLRFTDGKTGINLYKVYRVRSGATARDTITFGTSQLVVQAPDGAIVSLNARKLGTAPLDPVTVYEGQYLLRVQYEGMSWTERFDAPPGQKIEYKVNLTDP